MTGISFPLRMVIYFRFLFIASRFSFHSPPDFDLTMVMIDDIFNSRFTVDHFQKRFPSHFLIPSYYDSLWREAASTDIPKHRSF